MANLYNTMYNPDVLSCIANLSNDEVFTPPEVANAMLDMLPQELFSSPDTTFLEGNLYHFGILESNVHMAWMRAICCRLKSDYSYTINDVYNNFP